MTSTSHTAIATPDSPLQQSSTTSATQEESRPHPLTVIYTYEFNNTRRRPLSLHQDTTGNLAAGVGATVWDSALCLSKFLEKHMHSNPDFLNGAKVLELGAGTGLVGLAVAMLGAGRAQKVCVTDMPIALPLLERNVEVARNVLDEDNFTNPLLRVAPLQWGNDIHISALTTEPCFPPTHLLISDCFAWPHLYPVLVETIDRLCGEDTLVFLAYEKRDFGKEIEFFRRFGELFEFRNIPEEEQDERFRAEDIYLFRGWKRNA